MTSALIVTRRDGGPSLVVMDGRLLVLPTRLPVENMISRSVLSPTASSECLSGALVQPQPGFTLTILSESSPTDFIQKV